MNKDAEGVKRETYLSTTPHKLEGGAKCFVSPSDSSVDSVLTIPNNSAQATIGAENEEKSGENENADL